MKALRLKHLVSPLLVLVILLLSTMTTTTAIESNQAEAEVKAVSNTIRSQQQSLKKLYDSVENGIHSGNGIVRRVLLHNKSAASQSTSSDNADTHRFLQEDQQQEEQQQQQQQGVEQQQQEQQQAENLVDPGDGQTQNPQENEQQQQQQQQGNTDPSQNNEQNPTDPNYNNNETIPNIVPEGKKSTVPLPILFMVVLFAAYMIRKKMMEHASPSTYQYHGLTRGTVGAYWNSGANNGSSNTNGVRPHGLGGDSMHDDDDDDDDFTYGVSVANNNPHLHSSSHSSHSNNNGNGKLGYRNSSKNQRIQEM